MTADPEITARLEVALAAAGEAQGLILRHYSPLGVRFESKADGSPVTAADRGAEELIRSMLERSFGDDGLVGEEHGEREGRSAFRWVIDPIDGTKSFVHGVPLFGTLIGIQRKCGPGDAAGHAINGWRCVAGVARFPALDECIWASLGGGAWRTSRLADSAHGIGADRPRRVRVSAVGALGDSVVSTTCLGSMLAPSIRDRYLRLCAAARLSRGWSDCYGTLLVATGQIEAMIDPPMQLWDVAALEPIVHEAGGRLTGWDGKPTDGSTGAIATNGLVHDEVLAIMRGG